MTTPSRVPSVGRAMFAPRRGEPCSVYGAESMHYCALDHPHAPGSHVCACGATGPVAVDESVTLEQLGELRDVIEADPAGLA